MRRVKGVPKGYDEGITPAVATIILLAIVAGGYFTMRTVQEMNKPAVEAVESVSPLNAGLGALFTAIAAHLMETVLIIAGTAIVIAYIRKKRRA